MKNLVLILIQFIVAFSVYSQGNVGIGTATPTYPLTVYSATNGIVHKGPSVEVGTAVSAFAGYIKTFTNHPLHFATNNGPSQMVLTLSGELGLGTALPLAKLHMVDNLSNMLQMDNTTALNPGVTNRIIFRNGAYYTAMIGTYGTSSSTARLGFYTQAAGSPASLAERLTIQNNGYVGINNTSPTVHLDVNGSANINGSLELAGSITKPSTGNINWLPLAIGKINGSGVVLGGTGNIVVQKVSEGKFKIYIAGESQVFNNENKYSIFITPYDATVAVIGVAKIQSDNSIEINITRPHIEYWNSSCACEMFSRITSGVFYEPIDYGFSIVIYKF